jgi:hypothetical protein
MIDDRLNTRWHSCSTECEVENIPHHGGLRLVNREDFLDLLSALFGIGSAIAERWPRTVPEALAGVLAHRAQSIPGEADVARVYVSGSWYHSTPPPPPETHLATGVAPFAETI